MSSSSTTPFPLYIGSDNASGLYVEENTSLVLTCCILPFDLHLVSLPRHSIRSSALHSLLLTMFRFNEQQADDATVNTPSSFFSYTETEDEVSLLFDEYSSPMFPIEMDVMCRKQVYKALQVHEGEACIGLCGLINAIIRPLANAHINLLYFSTFSSDLILLAAEDLPAALAILKSHFGSGVTITTTTTDITTDTAAKIPEDPIVPPMTVAPGSMHLTPSSRVLRMAHLSPEDLLHVAYWLLGAVFFSPEYCDDSEDVFVSVTISRHESSTIPLGGQHEVTLILDERVLAMFPEGILTVHPPRWQRCEVSKGALNDAVPGSELVSALSERLSAARVSIFYVTTFSADFVLVEVSGCSNDESDNSIDVSSSGRGVASLEEFLESLFMA